MSIGPSQNQAPLIPQLSGSATGGTVNLRRYESLCHAPHQHGEGIRIAATGQPVAEVYRKADELGFVLRAAEVAAECGVSLDELFDAVRYVRDNG